MQNSPFVPQPAYFVQGKSSPFTEEVKTRVASPTMQSSANRISGTPDLYAHTQDAAYNGLPTYKFPSSAPMPIPSPMSVTASNPGLAFQSYPGIEYSRLPAVASSPGQYTYVASPMSASSSRMMSVSTSKSMSISSPVAPHSLSSSVRMGEPDESMPMHHTYSTHTQHSEFEGLAPPLPIMSLPQVMTTSSSTDQAQYSDYDSGKGSLDLGVPKYEYVAVNSTPTKMMSQSPGQFATPTRQGTGEAYLSAATFPGANNRYQCYPNHYTQSPVPAQGSPNPLNVQCMAPPPAPDSPSTFTPSTSYMPSRAAFTTVLPPMPRSAPSTPMGRQDARFLNATRGYSTPQPFQPAEFRAEIPQAVPMPPEFAHPGYTDAYLSPDISTAISPAFSQQSSYFPNAEYESYDNTVTLPEAPNVGLAFAPTASTSSMASASSSYVPYARVPKPAGSQKRVSPFSADLELSSAIKKVKKEKNAQKLKLSKMPSPPEFGSPAEYGAAKSDGMSTPDKLKIQRCKIACNQCRRTRLKCDGKRPCTSCVEKHLKFFPNQSEDEAKRTILENDSCQFEDFVRRRGKGKKTIQKEREEISARLLGESTSGGGGGGNNLGQTPTFDFSVDTNLGLYLHSDQYGMPPPQHVPDPGQRFTMGPMRHVGGDSRSGSSEYSTPRSY